MSTGFFLCRGIKAGDSARLACNLLIVVLNAQKTCIFTKLPNVFCKNLIIYKQQSQWYHEAIPPEFEQKEVKV